jgi:hypothetical protein
MTRVSIAVIILAFLLVLPGAALAGGGEHSLEQFVAEMAETPQQHTALADYYRSKAADARAGMQRHEQMGNSYMRGKASERKAMKQHCQRIAEQQGALAESYDALAELHEKEAKAE